MDLEFEILNKYIHVYKNVFEDIDLLFSYIKETENRNQDTLMGPWKDWYTFGKISNFDKVKDLESFSNTLNQKKEKYIYKENERCFKNVLFHYSNYYNLNVNLEKYVNVKNEGKESLWIINGPSYAKYFDAGGADIEKNRAMNYHTDFSFSEMKNEGHKLCLSFVTYFNDDYVGGEIKFFVNNKILEYKPSKGEILVFPSGNPNFLNDINEDLVTPFIHGVKLATQGEKYIGRTFLSRYEFVDPKDQKEWDENILKFGREETLKMYRKDNGGHNMRDVFHNVEKLEKREYNNN